MKVKRLFKSESLALHMVVETMAGEYKKFRICPAREIGESDLEALPYWKPIGKNGQEAEPYMYKMYGLEKARG